MGRIDKVFAGRKHPAFIGFAVAGDPDKETSIGIARALIEGGTDILELGVPFSDPVADGPVIQKADERALAAGTGPDTVFEIVRAIRSESEIPIVLLTYYNVVFRNGIENFYREAREAGADGILIADMPVEESGEVIAIATRCSIDPIFIVAPTTSEERIRAIAETAKGYLYLVAALGVTGVREHVSPDAVALVSRVGGHTHHPLALGFGISTPEHARTCAAAGADGVIVGSAIVRIVEDNLTDPPRMKTEISAYVRSMKEALTFT